MQHYKVSSRVRQMIVGLGALLLLHSGQCLSADDNQNGDAFSVVWSYDGELNLAADMTPARVAVAQLDDGVTQLRLSFPREGGATLRLETSLTPHIDELGGYGSDLYAHLDGFQIPDDGMSQPDSGVWLGWQNRYEAEAIRVDSDLWLISRFEAQAGPSVYQLDLTATPGESVEDITIRYFKGAREKARLLQIGLGDILLFELWSPFRVLCQLIWTSLLWIYGLAGSWGVALILLALIIRVFTIPVTRISLEYQRKALEQQNRMAAKVAELKRTSTGLELSEKMVALYEAERYDHLAPFKGMIGLFIQIPILIALFTVIGEMSVLREQGFLWIKDLSLSDRLFGLGVDLPFFGGYFNLLPCLMALATLLSTWASSLGSDVKVSGSSLYGMALVFFVFFYSFPAALVLYWFASNFFQLLQQLFELYLKQQLNAIGREE